MQDIDPRTAAPTTLYTIAYVQTRWQHRWPQAQLPQHGLQLQPIQQLALHVAACQTAANG
jgi:hypothetical protein